MTVKAVSKDVTELTSVEEAREWFSHYEPEKFQFEQIERILEANLDLMPTAFGRLCEILLRIDAGFDTRNYLITRRGNVFSTRWSTHDTLVRAMALDTDDIEAAGWIRVTWHCPFVEDAYSPATQMMYLPSAAQLRAIRKMPMAVEMALHRTLERWENTDRPRRPMPPNAPVIAHYERRLATKMPFRG